MAHNVEGEAARVANIYQHMLGKEGVKALTKHISGAMKRAAVRAAAEMREMAAEWGDSGEVVFGCKCAKRIRDTPLPGEKAGGGS